MKSPFETYLDLSKQLLEQPKLYCQKFEFNASIEQKHIDLFDNLWSHKHGFKDNKELPWGTWLIDAVFPRYLYKQNDESLDKMVHDKRLFDKPSFFKKSSCHSHIGRMCRPRPVFENTKYIGFLDYCIDRWKRDNHKSMPHFYFDVESPEWVFGELIKNPNQIKSGRTATCCSMNFSFRYDRKTNKVYIIQLLKHIQYSHSFGDVCALPFFANAFCKEIGIPKENAICCMFAVSISMDAPKMAREILKSAKKFKGEF